MVVAPCVRASFRLGVNYPLSLLIKPNLNLGRGNPYNPATDKKPSVAKNVLLDFLKMAIFIASTKSISRGKGQSAVASASYRAGVELQDERYGKKHDYSNRFGVMSADIILPSSLKNIGATIERGELWNKAEKAENRKDARVAREWLVNLPHELNKEQRKKLAHTFAQALADRYGVIADCAIHKPTDKEIERGADARNFHAHIMLTTRKAELNDNNEIVLTDKSTAELSDKKRREIKLERMSHEVKEVRQLWERVANEKLAEHGIELIDSRSYKDRQLDIEPQLKMGSVATKKERDKYERELRKAKEAQKKGEHYEIDNTPVTVPGQINAIIKERNELVFNSRKREQKNDRLRTAIDRAARAIGWTDKAVKWSDQSVKWINQKTEQADKAIKWADNRTAKINKAIDDSKQAINDSKQAITARVSRQRPTPNPFTNRRTASITRREQSTAELAEQQRRVDTETRRVDTDARQHKYEDKRLAERVANIKLNLANRLIIRNNDNMRVRWEWYETAEEYPDKFDKRQLETLDKFEKSLNVENLDYRKKLLHVRDLMNDDFIKEHSDIIDILTDPAGEREQYTEQYNANIASWLEFKASLDKQRQQLHEQLKQQLGNGDDVGRMTRETLTAVSYLEAVDSFINDNSQTAHARQLAEEDKAKTLTRTCEQFKLSYFDVLKLRDSTERNNYANALNSSLERFKQSYANQLSEDQNKAINTGLYSFEQDVQRTSSVNRFRR